MLRTPLSVLGSIVGLASYYCGVRRNVTLENLLRAFPEKNDDERKRIAKTSYRNLGRVFAEMLYLRFASRKNIIDSVTISNPDILLSLKSKGNGIIAVSAHFSNWEWMAMGGAPQLGGGFYIVIKNIVSSFAERFLQQMRSRTGNLLLGSGDVRGMYKALKQGSVVALLSDQAAPIGSVRVSFFGIETPTFEGPARMALRTRAGMVFAVCLPSESNEYQLIFHEIPFDDLTDESEESVKVLTARHTSILEAYIRQYPSLWLWQHRRWKNV